MTLQHLDTVIALVVVMLGASLLITIFTQAVSTLFAYRGSNLRWGLRVLFKNIHPALTDAEAASLAQEVLTHQMLSDSILSKFKNVPLVGKLTSRWRLASAVRVEELTRILPIMAQDSPPHPENHEAAQAIVKMAQASDPVATQEIRELLDTLSTLVPAEAAVIHAHMQQIAAAAQTGSTNLTASLKVWFDSTMDRVSQRFALQMRIWTVVFSVLLAFFVHLDVFRVMTQLSRDAELRAKLVGSAEAMSKQAAGILPEGAKSSVVPAIYGDAMKRLKSEEPAAAKGLGDPPSFDSRAAAIQWLRDGMHGSSQTGRLVARYQQFVDKGLESNADKLLDQSTEVQTILSNTGYQLFPDPYPQPWYKPWQTFTAREFWGTLAAAGLLSLGAPFWYNALKTLSNLRPVVAKKEEQEKQAGQAG